LREQISDVFEGLDDQAAYRAEILADGDHFVLVGLSIVGHGARSGLPVTLRLVSVTWFEDGKLTRVRGYLHRREALEAVGLAE
jgi:ketosteroid isomerase-like protein